CIRLYGSTEDVRVSNCKFEHVARAVCIRPENDLGRCDHLAVTDNEINFTDHGAIEISTVTNRARDHASYLGDVQVLRNKLYMIGGRSFRANDNAAIGVRFPETMEIAGNVIERCYSAGIFVWGGKNAGESFAKPLSRNLLFDNRVTNAMLSANDW